MSVKESTLNTVDVDFILQMYEHGMFEDGFETSHFVENGKIYHYEFKSTD